MVYIERNKQDALQNATAAIFGYNGTHFRIEVIKGDTFTMGDTSWSGGSRKSYAIFEIATMREARLPNFHPMFDGQVVPNKVNVQPGYLIVQHDIFCGKDMGITYHAHPEDYKVFELPPTIELTQAEMVVLKVTKELKSFGRKDEARRYKVTAAIFEKAKNSLIAKGLLAKNGSITVQGRNVEGTVKVPYYYSLPEDWNPQ
jgi:hypothetical protein